MTRENKGAAEIAEALGCDIKKVWDGKYRHPLPEGGIRQTIPRKKIPQEKQPVKHKEAQSTNSTKPHLPAEQIKNLLLQARGFLNDSLLEFASKEDAQGFFSLGRIDAILGAALEQLERTE